MVHQAFIDYYQALGVKLTATPQQIRAAYIDLAKQQHPDKGGNVLEMRQLNQAYSILRHPDTHREYDIRYRKHVLGEKVTDLTLTDNADWDLDDVDEFITQVYREDQRRLWLHPLIMSLSVVGVGLLLFVIIAVTRTMASSYSTPLSQSYTRNRPGK